MAKKKKDGSASKRARARRQPPSVEAVIVCEAVSQDPVLRRTSLYGIIDRLTINRSAAPVSLQIYSRLVGGNGKYEVGLVMTTPTGKHEETGHPIPVEFAKNQFVEGVARISQFAPKKAGSYRFYTILDGKQAGEPGTIRVRIKESEKKDD